MSRPQAIVSQIVSGRPIPPTHALDTQMLYPWQQMSVGDSFDATCDDIPVGKLIARLGSAVLCRQNRYPPEEYTVRKTGAHTVTVWKTS